MDHLPPVETVSARRVKTLNHAQMIVPEIALREKHAARETR
jgi:hypothetical protein